MFYLGWVTVLNAAEETGGKGFQFFSLDVDLSEEGFGEWYTVFDCLCHL